MDFNTVDRNSLQLQVVTDVRKRRPELSEQITYNLAIYEITANGLKTVFSDLPSGGNSRLNHIEDCFDVSNLSKEVQAPLKRTVLLVAGQIYAFADRGLVYAAEVGTNTRAGALIATFSMRTYIERLKITLS